VLNPFVARQPVRHAEPVTDAAELLLAYDGQLRTDAETPGATAVTRLGPLRLVTFAHGRGFVTYPHVAGADGERLAELVPSALDHFRLDAQISHVEWKTRGHDHVPGLHEALLDNGFVPEAAESIMIGRAALLDVVVTLPDGVSLRTVRAQDEVHAMAAMQDVVFGTALADGITQSLLDRLAREDGLQLWVAEHDGQIVSAGRLEPVPGTDFAGIWGGATLEAWRGRGIYRALTAARARAALAADKSLIHSDSTEFSRPILERSGLVKVSTTTPYQWSR
jgi:hypothetical protein